MPWWKEPTKDQWLAWWDRLVGVTPDAFDFATFLLIMVPIGNESKVPLGFMSGVLQGPVEHWLPSSPPSPSCGSANT
ncbi:MAG: hypothetical protein WAL10_25630 [Acetobacteraceae bacterium]